MDANTVYAELLETTPFVCALPQDDTHSWVTGQAFPADHIVVDMLFDGEVNSVHVALASEIVARLAGVKPYKGLNIKVKCELDGDSSDGMGCIKVHNLHPSVAVVIAGWLGSYGFDCHYSGGDDRFADTFYAFVKEAA